MKKRVNDINEKNLKDRFVPPKSMAKKEVAKIRPGTWIEVWYRDAPNGVVLLLDKMDPVPGEVSLFCLDPITMKRRYQVTNRQVVRVVDRLKVPSLIPCLTTDLDGAE